MADKILTKTDLSNVETQVEVVLDNIYILPTTKTITIRTIKQYLDADNNVLRKEAGETINYLDRDADPQSGEGARTEYTDFLSAAGIDIDKIKAAL